ncbi:hypothetical protein EDEG_02622 [Edhazardia aedis USNM 41457]|uniref:Uncharacterized protein n=1 Tax=Edhazardia aedis (strain USNM 41457) TaxID=1003232 RepID=J8ZTH1_EDHAE|nr:hypothetical protein EDEG_02622 [Edhazardia aedis USNM 41457]|eukprot:EJW02978.1 hypothetical protein EDEG_02622 [Edhazardia aedis USNM 41457]
MFILIIDEKYHGYIKVKILFPVIFELRYFKTIYGLKYNAILYSNNIFFSVFSFQSKHCLFYEKLKYILSFRMYRFSDYYFKKKQYVYFQIFCFLDIRKKYFELFKYIKMTNLNHRIETCLTYYKMVLFCIVFDIYIVLLVY